MRPDLHERSDVLESDDRGRIYWDGARASAHVLAGVIVAMCGAAIKMGL